MAAPILEVDPVHPSPRHVERAVELLGRGAVIAYPTDTYYGLGCDLFSKKAIEKLYALKDRNRKKPLSFLVPDLSDVAKYALVSNFAYRTMKSLTPGPFTFILPATRQVPEMMQTKQKQVGIRVPDSALARALAESLGRPIITTSATNSEGEPLIDAKDIRDELGHGVELILDGGVRLMEPSTVVSLIGDTVEILRQGKGRLES
jgi:tRNA threonylcarbamoyl adenosine modification protein (Sua5/YciO/YrdC/YwlC family)